MGGGSCPPCVPEVCSKVLPSSVKYFVSTEVLGEREGVLCVSGLAVSSQCARGV